MEGFGSFTKYTQYCTFCYYSTVVLLYTLVLQYDVVCAVRSYRYIVQHSVYVIVCLNCCNAYSLNFSVIRGTFGAVDLKLSRFHCNNNNNNNNNNVKNKGDTGNNRGDWDYFKVI